MYKTVVKRFLKLKFHIFRIEVYVDASHMNNLVVDVKRRVMSFTTCVFV